MNWQRLGDRLVCPTCQVSLRLEAGSLRCPKCIGNFPVIEGVPNFLAPADREAGLLYVGQLKRQPARWAERFFSPMGLFAPTKFVEDLQEEGRKNFYGPLKRFLDSFAPDALVVDVGSGSRRLIPGIINLDPVPFPDVDLVGSGAQLPFASGSVSGLVLQHVLEHVPNPSQCIAESFRVLAPGGGVFVEVPFVYPVHSEHDYARWSLQGLAEICSLFARQESGISVGSGSALGAALFSFGDERFFRLPRLIRSPAYACLYLACAAVRLLDAWPARGERQNLYGACYFIGRKP